MDDVFGIYAVGSSAEEPLVMEHYGRIAGGYPPPLVLNVEQPANLHCFLELRLNTGREALQYHLVSCTAVTLHIRQQRLEGGCYSDCLNMVVVPARRNLRLSWLIGALFRMVYGCLTPTDVALSVCELTLELDSVVYCI